MGNFEKLSVLVIVVIIVMILVVAIYTWTDNPDGSATTTTTTSANLGDDVGPIGGPKPAIKDPWIGLLEPGEDLIEPTPVPVPVPTPTPQPTPQPAPKPEPSTPTSSEPTMYTIKSGETLSEICQRELGSYYKYQKQVFELNPGLDPLQLREGQQIKLPPQATVSDNPPHVKGEAPSLAGGPVPGQDYVTRRGDTLERISKAAYRTADFWPEIWSKNLSALPKPGDIREGMKLFIPATPSYR
ncbi:MAG: LysM peptidoglycan-binding domain-containing protein [Planctomycetota bacterium]|nr:LysM peptidoglycan-binding domain-containing protein [Planctomycetota bacterium]